MYKIVILKHAEEDLKRAIEWYQIRQKNLGKQFLICFQEAIEEIHQHPEAYPVKHGPLRMKLVSKFPYAIFYRIKENTIQIHSCLHYKQNIFSILQQR